VRKNIKKYSTAQSTEPGQIQLTSRKDSIWGRAFSSSRRILIIGSCRCRQEYLNTVWIWTCHEHRSGVGIVPSSSDAKPKRRQELPNNVAVMREEHLRGGRRILATVGVLITPQGLLFFQRARTAIFDGTRKSIELVFPRFVNLQICNSINVELHVRERDDGVVLARRNSVLHRLGRRRNRPMSSSRKRN